MNQFNDIAKLDEREVQTEFDNERRSLLIFTTRMEITVEAATQLRNWLNNAIPEATAR